MSYNTVPGWKLFDTCITETKFDYFSGKSPSQLTLEYLKNKGISREQGHIRIPSDSPDSVTVPGAASGWIDVVEHFGGGKVKILSSLNILSILCLKCTYFSRFCKFAAINF